MSKRGKNRYVVVYLAPRELYDGTQPGRKFRSKPAAHTYAIRQGNGFAVHKIIRPHDLDVREYPEVGP